MPRKTIVGLIADTHGLLRPQALHLLRGSDHIVHAGDVGNPAILAELAAIAPLTAIRGNIDIAPWAATLPDMALLTVAGARIHVLHSLADLVPHQAGAGYHAVIHGHSHKPEIRRQDGVLYINPGSAGPRRFSLPISLARLTIEAGNLSAELLAIDPQVQPGA